MNKKSGIVLVIVLIFVASNVNAGWKDIRDKVKETTEKATQGVKNTTKKTKEHWDQLESPCARCGKNTRLGKLCAECKKESASNTAKDVGRIGREAVNSGQKGVQNVGEKWNEYKPHVIEMGKASVEKYKEMSPIVKEKYKYTLEKIRDPESREKATKALVTAIEVKRQIDQAKKEGVYKSVSKLTSLKLPENFGGKTLGQEMGERFIKMNPELAGTGIEDDPAVALTAVICHDRGYLLNEFKFIKRDGRNVSLMESVAMSSPLNSSDTIKSLKVMAAMEKTANCMSTGEGGIEALESVGDAMNSVNDK